MGATIYIVRHGETEWNRGGIFRGSYDIPLNENGREQARLAAASMKSFKIHAAYTSPLSRSSETAEIVLKSHNIEAVPCEEIKDFDYGEWTGISDDEVAKKWPMEHTDWKKTPHLAKIPGGDTLAGVFKRSFNAMEEIARKHNGQNVALFAHRVINKLLILGALGLGLERFPFIIQGNCCINEIERIESGYLIKSINDISHIRNAGIDLLKADF